MKLTTEFAFPSQVTVAGRSSHQIAANSPPYTAPYYGVGYAVIIAQNEDQEAWYCNTPPNGTGGFFVPTYDFGNIPQGQTATHAQLPVLPAAATAWPHLLFNMLLNWQATGQDVFMNRTTDLKIGDWLDVLAGDNGFSYPVRRSDIWAT